MVVPDLSFASRNGSWQRIELRRRMVLSGADVPVVLVVLVLGGDVYDMESDAAEMMDMVETSIVSWSCREKRPEFVHASARSGRGRTRRVSCGKIQGAGQGGARGHGENIRPGIGGRCLPSWLESVEHGGGKA